uniref:Uncharacterized protein n=1 Tax=Setaria italica TaxID=4555 RepID=K4AMQ6_SETIT
MNLTLAQAQQAGAGETTTRKKKVIKKRLPQELIKYMIATPHPIIGEPLTDDQFTKHSKGFREAYTKSKAIIDQYNAKGYTEDEGEVTDDEEETVEN